MAWEPLTVTTPESWRCFFGRRIGSTVIGLSIAFGPTTLCLGVELITGPTRGLALLIGPFWIGVAVLKKKDSRP